MVYVLSASLVLYVVLLLLLIRGWRKLFVVHDTPMDEPLLSVIVPCRNEEAIIGNLLRDLGNQDYANLEICLVDDHSTDKTATIARQVMVNHPNFRVITSEGEGKKRALSTGIRHSRGTIIVTTDADCTMPSGWLTSIQKQYGDPRVMMVSGGVSIHEDSSFFSRLQAMEFASLIGSGAALIGLKKPVMCNGANLSFRKKAFETVGGYDDNLHIASGDDEFLMRKIATAYPGSIRFAADRQSLVITRPSASLASFMRQRIRWAGKWKYNSSAVAVGVALLIFFFQCTFITSLVLLGKAAGMLFFLALAVLFLRAVVEISFLYPVCKFFNVRWHWDAFLVLQIVYPFYVVITGLFSNLMSVNWKERKLKW